MLPVPAPGVLRLLGRDRDLVGGDLGKAGKRALHQQRVIFMAAEAMIEAADRIGRDRPEQFGRPHQFAAGENRCRVRFPDRQHIGVGLGDAASVRADAVIFGHHADRNELIVAPAHPGHVEHAPVADQDIRPPCRAEPAGQQPLDRLGGTVEIDRGAMAVEAGLDIGCKGRPEIGRHHITDAVDQCGASHGCDPRPLVLALLANPGPNA